MDRSAPTVLPNGELVWVQNADLGNSSPYGLTLGTYDQYSGIASVSWKDQTTSQQGTVGTSCGIGPCEPDFFRDLDLYLAEGKHVLVETAADLAGNVGQSATWTVAVDKTVPKAPINLFAPRDPSTGESFLVWDDGVTRLCPTARPARARAVPVPLSRRQRCLDGPGGDRR